MIIITMGFGLAKNIFSEHGVNKNGQVELAMTATSIS
jgi:hypothetical protein